MKKIFFFFFSIFLLTLLTCKATTIPYEGTLGYLTDGANDFKQKDTKLAFHFWVEELAKEHNVTVHLAYYDEISEMLKSYEDMRVQHIFLNAYFFLKHYDQITSDSNVYFLSQKDDHLFEDMLFLVKKDSNINSIKDLKNKIVVTPSDNYMGKMDLDFEILKHQHHSANRYINSYLYTNNFSTAILKTYFGKADLCIVPRYAYNTVVKMNPDVGNKLKILHVSPNTFLLPVEAFEKKTDPVLIKLYSDFIVNMPNAPRGKIILDLFKVKKVSKVSLATFTPLLNYYHEYVNLEKKYGDKHE